MPKLNKEQVQWYFEETYWDYWETITDFLNNESESKKVLVDDIKNQTKDIRYKKI
jgi:hypothetical protein